MTSNSLTLEKLKPLFDKAAAQAQIASQSPVGLGVELSSVTMTISLYKNTDGTLNFSQKGNLEAIDIQYACINGASDIGAKSGIRIINNV